MHAQLLLGDCLETMKTLPSKSVNCCVTSPPCWGLRDYGHSLQIGLENTLDEYVRRLVLVFRETRRLLKDDGTLWLNLGDAYGKTKQLAGIPWRVAFALQSDGWILRQDIVWHKPSPMPESVKDRCTRAHEYIFMLSKSPKYYYDQLSLREAATMKPQNRNTNGRGGKDSGYQEHRKAPGVTNPDSRNRRSVWTIASHSYPGAHFATMPPDLARDCVLAGCPLGGTVLDPFGGSGTTAERAIAHGRNAILIELNPDYLELQRQRLSTAHTVCAQPTKPFEIGPESGPLFEMLNMTP